MSEAVWSIDARTGERRRTVATETSPAEVSAACRAAEATRAALDQAGISGRAALLRAMAAGLEGAGDELVEVADAESALGEPRLRGELARTVFQLRLFAEALEEGSWLGVTIDHADPSAKPVPVPDLRRMLVPLGVVAVFGASNFPLAFSVPGGDTASALAAGCPVVVKAHPAHPDLSERCARIMREAAEKAGLSADVVQTVHGQEAGAALVTDPHVKAVGFTGSVRGGRALFDLARSRPEPIPFYGELGSLNPVVVTPAAAAERAEDIAAGLAGSFTLGVGQFCTKPGLVFLPGGAAGDRLTDRMARSVTEVAPGSMLTDGIRSAFRSGLADREALPGVRVVASGADGDERTVSARLLAAPAALLSDAASAELLLDECFGPVTVLVSYEDEDELFGALDRVPGSLTGTVHTGANGDELAGRAGSRLSERVGRVVWNGYPTGVAVTWAQQHGGPYPSSTDAAATSVGTAAMQRFLRPVTHQDTPPELLPEALRDDNPLGVPRRVDGRLEAGPRHRGAAAPGAAPGQSGGARLNRRQKQAPSCSPGSYQASPPLARTRLCTIQRIFERLSPARPGRPLSFRDIPHAVSWSVGHPETVRVLIVDDSDHFLVAARLVLQRGGIEVVGTAVNGVEALRLAKELRPDVVLLDIYLGADNGFEVAERLGERVRTPSGEDWRPAIIFISTHAEVEFAELIDESPAIGFLGKSTLSAKRIRELLYGRAD